MKQKIEDNLILSVLVGTIAATGANLFLYSLNLLIPGNTINMPQLTLEFFISVEPYTFIKQFLGFIWSLAIGGTYTFIYINILNWTGWNNLLFKAVVVVTGVWVLLAGIIIRLLNLSVETRDNPLAMGAFFTAHLFFALIMGLLVIKFGESN